MGYFLIPLKNLMRFLKIQKKKVTKLVFKLFWKNWVSKGLFAALYHCHGNCWDIADTLKKLYANSFIQMTKHPSSDRDTSVVIFLHWTHTVSRRKPYQASLRRAQFFFVTLMNCDYFDPCPRILTLIAKTFGRIN